MQILVLVSQFERLFQLSAVQTKGSLGNVSLYLYIYIRLCSDDNPGNRINRVCFRLNQVLQKMDEIRESGRMIVTEGGWLYECTRRGNLYFKWPKLFQAFSIIFTSFFRSRYINRSLHIIWGAFNAAFYSDLRSFTLINVPSIIQVFLAIIDWFQDRWNNNGERRIISTFKSLSNVIFYIVVSACLHAMMWNECARIAKKRSKNVWKSVK